MYNGEKKWSSLTPPHPSTGAPAVLYSTSVYLKVIDLRIIVNLFFQFQLHIYTYEKSYFLTIKRDLVNVQSFIRILVCLQPFFFFEGHLDARASTGAV